jgi:hypothetical protein
MALFPFANARTCAARLLDFTRTLLSHSLRLWSDLCKLPSGAPTTATRVQRAHVIAAHFTRVWSQQTTSYTHDPPTYMSHACLAYQRSLSNPYFFLGLRRPRSRNSADRPSRRASVITRSDAGSDLPGGRRTMTGSDDDAPAARGPPLGTRARLQHTKFCMRALQTSISLTHPELTGELSLLP